MIIGIGGKKQTGKSTLASALTKLGWTPYSFADPLKDVVAQAFGESPLLYHTQEGKERELEHPLVLDQTNLNRLISRLVGLRAGQEYCLKLSNTAYINYIAGEKEFRTRRQALQWVGTDLVRNYLGNDFWVAVAERKFEFQGIGSRTNYVVPDARFENERGLIRKYNGILVLITSDKEGADDHVSENSLGDPKDYDVVVHNDLAGVDQFLGDALVKIVDKLK